MFRSDLIGTCPLGAPCALREPRLDITAAAIEQLGGRDARDGAEARPVEGDVAELVSEMIAVQRAVAEALPHEIGHLTSVTDEPQAEQRQMFCRGFGRSLFRPHAPCPFDIVVD